MATDQETQVTQTVTFMPSPGSHGSVAGSGPAQQRLEGTKQEICPCPILTHPHSNILTPAPPSLLSGTIISLAKLFSV